MTSALKFRDMILSKFTPKEEMEGLPNKSTSPDNSSSAASAKSRLSFSVDSLLQKKIEEEDDDDLIEGDQSEIEDEDIEEEAEDLTSNNNSIETTKNHSNSRIAMPTPLMANSLAGNLMRPQPHFLAAGIAAMAAAAMASSNNAVTSNSTSSTSTPASISSNGPWSGAPSPHGHPTPPLSFPFGLPGLRHPLFSSGIPKMTF